MNVIRKHLSMINKNAFQKSMIKITWSDDIKLAKDKHYQLVINTLLGLNDKTSFEEGVKIILEYYQQVDVKHWMKSLKILMLIHYIENNVPQIIQLKISQYIQDPSAFEKQQAHAYEMNMQRNGIKKSSDNADYLAAIKINSPPTLPTKSSQKSNQLKPPTSSSCQQIDVVHQIIVQKYYSYLITLNQKLECISYLNEKEINSCSSFIQEWQRIKSLLVLFSIVQNFTWELEVSLTNFKKVTVVQKIACLLSNNLSLIYSMLKNIVQSVQSDYLQFENTQDFVRFFTFYSEFIVITKNISKFNLLKIQISQLFASEFKSIELYVINKELNREIELYNLNVKSLRRSKPGITDSMSLGVSTQIGDFNIKANKEFNRTKTTEMCFTKKTQADDDNSIFGDNPYMLQNADKSKQDKNIDNLESNLHNNRVKIQNDQNNDYAIDFNQNQKKEIKEADTKNNKSIKTSKEVVSDFKFIKLDYKDTTQNDVDQLKKKTSAEQNSQNDLEKLSLHTSNSKKQLSTPVYYNEIQDFKVQSKQFYDVKNNPLSFLRNNQPDQNKQVNILGLDEDDEQDLIQLKKVKNECFSQQNDEYQNEQIQEIESSKNFNSDNKSNQSEGTYSLSNQSEKNGLNFNKENQQNNLQIQ
ncbi:hypothetical protein TTHERM_00463480 (macronuclear) [Tetrahymena thermophila SB210]|uniref:ENTH domain protein n=1 Tax=Tetrahymena thermophila (strain SB210) TaxID=312017 RepID=Q23PT5_TETTS|nr:hypothetical protein TTHERM_00463480 [Tetrahymena thermophila SB210]EAR98600.1 hypothetical protein TTHERM_00463480 [Tetrahymena thermophila SB210]|eukprot:XP_001018845.1 hypothetical protein TTHERM_00463480 [Tetrahymena thermophila SB210]